MARGRKSLFREEYIQLAENYALLGATDDELADFFGVSKQTLNKWKKDYPEFLDSLKTLIPQHYYKIFFLST